MFSPPFLGTAIQKWVQKRDTVQNSVPFLCIVLETLARLAVCLHNFVLSLCVIS